MDNLTYVWIAIAIIGWLYKTFKGGQNKEVADAPTSTPSLETDFDYQKRKIEDLFKEVAQKEKVQVQEVVQQKQKVQQKQIAVKKPAMLKNVVQKKSISSSLTSKNVKVKLQRINKGDEEEINRFDEYKISNTQNNNYLALLNRLHTSEGAKEAFMISEVFAKKY